jgi:hypothetical protein
LDVDLLVKAELAKLNAGPETSQLWDAILAAYDNGGPRDVKELLEEKVKDSRRRAGKEVREVGKAVAVATRSRRPLRR